MRHHPSPVTGEANEVQGDFYALAVAAGLRAKGVDLFADREGVVTVSRTALTDQDRQQLRTHAEALHRQLLREQNGRRISERDYWSRREGVAPNAAL